jgi:hypothetical protein
MQERPIGEGKSAVEPVKLPPRLVEVYRLLAIIARQILTLDDSKDTVVSGAAP